MEFINRSTYRPGVIKRIAVIGDSRCAGASLGDARGGACAISPLLNLALGGRAVAINPGVSFLNNNVTESKPIYYGFSQGALGYNTMTGFVREAIKMRPDCILFALGYNDATATGTQTTKTIDRMRFLTSAVLESGIPYVAIATPWGPGDKDADSLAAICTAIRDHAAALGERCILIDRADYYAANAATFYNPTESPGIHWSILGQDTFVADIMAALQPYLASDYQGYPNLGGTDFAYPVEMGIAYGEVYAAGGSFAAADRDTSHGIIADGLQTTSASGTCATSTKTSTAFSGLARGRELLTGAMGVEFGAYTALNNTLTSGRRYAFAMGLEVEHLGGGSISDFSSFLNIQVRVNTTNTGTGAVTNQNLYRLATSSHLGTRGLVYFEFEATRAETHLLIRTELEQRSTQASAVALDCTGKFWIDNPTLIDLDALAGSWPM